MSRSFEKQASGLCYVMVIWLNNKLSNSRSPSRNTSLCSNMNEFMRIQELMTKKSKPRIKLNHNSSTQGDSAGLKFVPWEYCSLCVLTLKGRVVQGYSRDAWLADFIFRETWIQEIILRDSCPEGFAMGKLISDLFKNMRNFRQKMDGTTFSPRQK